MAPENTTVYGDAKALAHGTAAWLLDKATATQGPFAVCLAGGTTPRHMYELLASAEFAGTFPWARVHWFWGDERWVPHDHPRSNCGMVQAAMLQRAPVPSGNIHPMPYDPAGSPEAAAESYDRELRAFAAQSARKGGPLFDVTLLGLGEDGHIASLFPKSPALAGRSTWARTTTGPDNETRITLTYPALEDSADVAFLVAGANKQAALAAVWSGADLPAARLRPVGTVHWFLDAAAVNATRPPGATA
jgi:6-phosphogluconolactonase